MTVDNYKDDPLYPRIVRATDVLLRRGNVVAAVDVLVEMGLLKKERLEDWRFGRVPYLEAVIVCNLTRLGRILRILRFHAHDLRLMPSLTVYKRWGKGPKQPLRFTKTNEARVEKAYSTHLVWPGKTSFHESKKRREEERLATVAPSEEPVLISDDEPRDPRQLYEDEKARRE